MASFMRVGARNPTFRRGVGALPGQSNELQVLLGSYIARSAGFPALHPPSRDCAARPDLTLTDPTRYLLRPHWVRSSDG